MKRNDDLKPLLLNLSTVLCDNLELLNRWIKLQDAIKAERAKLVTKWQRDVAASLAEENFQPAVATYASRHCRTKYGARTRAEKLMQTLVELQNIKADQK